MNDLEKTGPFRDAQVRELMWISEAERCVYPLARQDLTTTQRNRRKAIGALVARGLVEATPWDGVKAYKPTLVGLDILWDLIAKGRVTAAFPVDYPSVPSIVRNDPRWNPR